MQKLQEEASINILKARKTYCGYILNAHFKEMNAQMQENIIKFKGDIFKIFISMYDCVDNNLIKDEDMKFYRSIFENLKTSEDSKILKMFLLAYYHHLFTFFIFWLNTISIFY